MKLIDQYGKLVIVGEIMKAKELCYIATMAAIETIMFTTFSYILYLECITFTIVLFGMVFRMKQSVLASFGFTVLVLCIQGVTPWTLLYCLVYPTYSFILGVIKKHIRGHIIILSTVCGLFSFCTGQILQLPYIIASETLALAYFIIGLKTSLIQGILSFILCYICYKPIFVVLSKIERGM